MAATGADAQSMTMRSHVRTAWVPVVVGLSGGWMVALAASASAGTGFDPLPLAFSAGLFGAAGMLVGAVAAVAMIVSAATVPGVVGQIATAAVASVGIAGVLTAGLTRGFPRDVWAAVVTAAVAAVAHGVAARRRQSATARDGSRAVRIGPTTGGIVAIALGCLTAPPLAVIPQSLRCSLLVGGVAGDGYWSCPDSKGYVGAVIAMGGLVLLVAVIGIGVGSVVRRPRQRAVVYLLVAVALLIGATVTPAALAPAIALIGGFAIAAAVELHSRFAAEATVGAAPAEPDAAVLTSSTG